MNRTDDNKQEMENRLNQPIERTPTFMEKIGVILSNTKKEGYKAGYPHKYLRLQIQSDHIRKKNDEEFATLSHGCNHTFDNDPREILAYMLAKMELHTVKFFYPIFDY